MLHHLSLPVSDLRASGAFYDAALGALGQRRVFEDATAIGYGVEDGKDLLCLKLRAPARAAGPGFHLAFAAATPDAVARFHADGLAAGGRDNGPPGPRPQYGPHYHAAFLVDPDGHALEAVCNQPPPPPDAPVPTHRTAPSPVIVSLDVASADEARALVARLGPDANHVKIGLQLLTAAGPALVREFIGAGRHVFLDLKLHEIPNSVAGAIAAAGQLGVGLVTVHASAGSAVLRAAVDAARPYPALKVLALTVITSLADADLPGIGLAPNVRDQVRRLAGLAVDAGCHGIVASPGEAGDLRAALPPQGLVVCPGIQLAAGPSDHARVATPEAAARAGATHVVVGRAITDAADPGSAFRSALVAFRRGADAPRATT